MTGEKMTKKKIAPPPKLQLSKSSDLQTQRNQSGLDIWNNPGEINDAIFQHSVFCQSFLPYRKVDDDLSLWEHVQGRVSINVQTIKQKHPLTGEFVNLGLPYGTKARLILAYLNTQAIKSGSPQIDVESSLSAFIEAMGLSKKGKNYNEVKNQLARIAASVITLNYVTEQNRSLNVRFSLVKKYDLWFPKEDNQRVLWSSQIELTNDYFEELVKHAIPLDVRALGALKNNAMAIDIYSWLAQRLHRIDRGKPQFVAWQNLKDQFGYGYHRMTDFKVVFRKTLAIVKTQYIDANLEEDENKGFWLKHSSPPIEKKSILILPPSK